MYRGIQKAWGGVGGQHFFNLPLQCSGWDSKYNWLLFLPQRNLIEASIWHVTQLVPGLTNKTTLSIKSPPRMVPWFKLLERFDTFFLLNDSSFFSKYASVSNNTSSLEQNIFPLEHSFEVYKQSVVPGARSGAYGGCRSNRKYKSSSLATDTSHGALSS